MAIEALCPTCGAVFNLKDEYEGKKVRCKKCEQIFTVGGGKSADRDDDRGVKTKADAKKSARDDDDDEVSTSKKNRAAAKRGRDDDDDRPKRKGRRGRDDNDDDDDDKPRSRKRTYHDDDDDDDDDRPRRKAPKKSGGGSGVIIGIIGGVVFLVLLICGGIGYAIYKVADAADDAIADAAQQAQQDAFNANGGNPWGGFEQQPADMGQALTFLKGNDLGQRRGAATWLSNQPLDAGRQKEVATALEALVKDPDDNTCAAGARAMRVWGTIDNGPALATALKSRPEGGIPGEAHKQLMAALGHVKYGPGADEIMRFLNNFFIGADAERALADFGAGAEPAVLKAYFHPDGGVRARARGLCVRFGTKPPVILDQAVADLGSIDRGRTNAVVEWLSRNESNDAQQAVRADPARRKSVAVALNKVIDDPQTNNDNLVRALRSWGTGDNVPGIIRKLENDPWKKKEYGDALIAIANNNPADRPVVEAQIKPLLNHRDGGVVGEAKRVLLAVGGADSKFEALIVDLKSGDNRRIQDAARTLERTPVDQKQRPAVVEGLLAGINGDGFFQGNDTVEAIAKALAVWATKDDGAAVVDKLTPLKKPFLTRARGVLIEWLGKQKVEAGIALLAGLLVDRDEYQAASKALQAMGPELGEKIEAAVGTLNTTDRNQLAECFRVLGAVGTKKSLPLLNSQVTAFARKDVQLATIAKQAADAITARGK
jgi:predicted Zn finger-like uncharacterized protein